jgi:hypothetical protein
MSALFVFKGGYYSQKAQLFNPLMTGFSAAMTLLKSMAVSSYALAPAGCIAAAGALRMPEPLYDVICVLAAVFCRHRCIQPVQRS